MRYLPCLLLWAFLQVWGQSEVQQKNYNFRCLQMSSFANRSWSRTDVVVWLEDLQTHRWSNDSDTISFTKPWSQGKFSNQQWEKLQHIFQVYRVSFTRDMQELVKMMQPQEDYPFEIQFSAGCEMYGGNATESFLHVAFQGKYVVRFQGTSWQTVPGAPSWFDLPIKVLNADQGTNEMVQTLLNDTCPQFVRGLLEAGKQDLEKQEKPVAWLSSSPNPAHGHLQLVCHVSGFYPKPVWVMWMRGDQEQQGTHRGDILPNADETWYLRATLDVEAREVAGLACRVKHSSLGGQDIVLDWDARRVSTGLIVFIVAMVVLVLCALSYCLRKKRCSYQDIL
ncbi:antigen-presenting glycoprotein CD1d [Apodemus sylvaticus]|uniref:antigen-presenting glycoprotein CD1d n=1 Tax=Apodemus sylvaticus TaxID=10129 RepID=UPI00224395AC|nr:antigen-presenting glycoprotein CD1d [Apodemus sylvaticus]